MTDPDRFISEGSSLFDNPEGQKCLRVIWQACGTGHKQIMDYTAANGKRYVALVEPVNEHCAVVTEFRDYNTHNAVAWIRNRIG